MKLTTTKRFFCGLVLAAAVTPVFAEDAFHLSYRQQNLSSDGVTQSGMLLLTVVNVSGEAVRELSAWVPGPNHVTFDNRVIAIGDLAEGQQVEILDEFHVPQELADPDATEDSVTWAVQFTNGLGERVTTEVTAEKVPE